MIIYPVKTFTPEDDKHRFFSEQTTYFTSLREAARFAEYSWGDLLTPVVVYEKYDEQERERALAKLTSQEKHLLGLE